MSWENDELGVVQKLHKGKLRIHLRNQAKYKAFLPTPSEACQDQSS